MYQASALRFKLKNLSPGLAGDYLLFSTKISNQIGFFT